MSQQPVTTIQTGAVQVKSEVEYIPFGSEDRIKLSISIIQKFIAVPTKEGELPDDRDSTKFMMLCRSRRLNPFEGDAFLIGFKKQNEPKANWSLITSISAFYKRAEVHPEYNGIESGVIISNGDDQIIEREGDIVFEGEKLLGGWARTHFKSRKFPMVKKVRLDTYRKPFGVWVNDPAGMICKVAECQSLRDAFPTMLGGMLLREEHIDIESTVTASTAKRPDFAKGLPAAELTQGKPEKAEKTVAALPAASQTPPESKEPYKAHTPAPNAAPAAASEQPAPAQTTTAEAAAGLAPAQGQGTSLPPFVPNPLESDALQSVRLQIHGLGITEQQLVAWMQTQKLLKPEQRNLSDAAENKLTKLGLAIQSSPAEFRDKIVAEGEAT